MMEKNNMEEKQKEIFQEQLSKENKILEYKNQTLMDEMKHISKNLFYQGRQEHPQISSLEIEQKEYGTMIMPELAKTFYTLGKSDTMKNICFAFETFDDNKIIVRVAVANVSILLTHQRELIGYMIDCPETIFNPFGKNRQLFNDEYEKLLSFANICEEKIVKYAVCMSCIFENGKMYEDVNFCVCKLLKINVISPKEFDNKIRNKDNFWLSIFNMIEAEVKPKFLISHPYISNADENKFAVNYYDVYSPSRLLSNFLDNLYNKNAINFIGSQKLLCYFKPYMFSDYQDDKYLKCFFDEIRYKKLHYSQVLEFMSADFTYPIIKFASIYNQYILVEKIIGETPEIKITDEILRKINHFRSLNHRFIWISIEKMLEYLPDMYYCGISLFGSLHLLIGDETVEAKMKVERKGLYLLKKSDNNSKEKYEIIEIF